MAEADVAAMAAFEAAAVVTSGAEIGSRRIAELLYRPSGNLTVTLFPTLAHPI